jgi:Holliday junction resolvase
MSTSKVSIDERRLYDIAEEYKQRGYAVLVSPSASRLPKFLNKFTPDLVAEGPNESVVVEIKSSRKPRGTEYWKQLSSVLQQHPGWRLELVVNNKSIRQSPETIHEGQIRQRLQEGQQLSEQGMLSAALLVTWSAVEAAMRLASEKHEIELPDFRPSTVISRLYSDGLLERQEYDFLVNCMQVRNLEAHGFIDGRLKPGVVKRLQRIALRLLQ